MADLRKLGITRDLASMDPATAQVLERTVILEPNPCPMCATRRQVGCRHYPKQETTTCD